MTCTAETGTTADRSTTTTAARRRVAVFIGTRPEAIKLAPVARALRASDWAVPVVVTTGQHGEAVDEVLRLFEVDVDLALSPAPTSGIGEASVEIQRVLSGALEALRPDLAVVQGDTLTAYTAAFCSFLRRIPVVHVEAGLRSGDLANPFPEEGNRTLIARIAALHLAPTRVAEDNLLREGVPARDIHVTGNTVVDALRHLRDRGWHATAPAGPGTDPLEGYHRSERPLVLVTAHRRESWGAPIRRIGAAVSRLAAAHPQADFLVVTHMNPAVRREFTDALDHDGDNLRISGALPYLSFVRLLARSALAITDSGGLQEECAALGIPVVITRETTERVEVLEAGLGELVGTDTDLIVKTAERFLGPEGAPAVVATDLYGDGRAAERSVAHMARVACARPM